MSKSWKHKLRQILLHARKIMSELKITQYNVWKNKKNMMFIFLSETACQKCKIVALQELWQNFHMNITYCFSSSRFWSVYSCMHCSKACFLVSKKISISTWTVEYSWSNLSILTLMMKDMIIHIYNIYSSSLKFLHNVNSEFSIYDFQQALSKSDEHLLVDDFNIHHFK